MFKEFSELLKAHKQEIINSFIYITDNNGNERRLSNGPMEGYNRTPKDFKRNSRGLSNFEYVRSRLIWANRKNESILNIPKSKRSMVGPKNNSLNASRQNERNNLFDCSPLNLFSFEFLGCPLKCPLITGFS